MGVKCMPKKKGKKQLIDEDNNPRNAVDQVPKPKRLPIYMVKYPKFDDPKLKAELEIANYEIQELDRSIHQIKENLTLAKRDRVILSQNLDILGDARKPLERFLEENKIPMKTLRQVLWRIGGSNTVARACSAEEQLNEIIRILDYRTTHETIDISEENQIVQELKILKGMRGNFIACDAMRAEIWDAIANRDSIKLGDKEKSRDLQLFKELIQQDTAQKQYIAKFVETWDAELEKLKEKRDEANENVQELQNKMNAPYENNYKLLSRAKNLAAEKNDEALKVLVDSEVNNFMSLYSSDKEFRDSYARRILPSLDSRKLSRDGRHRNRNEKPIMEQETAEMVMKPNLKRKETTQEQKVSTNKVAMLKKEKREEKRVAGEAIRAEREAEKQQKIRDNRARRARKKAAVKEVSSEEAELVQQPSEAMEQQGHSVEQVQTRGQVPVPEILRERARARRARARAARIAVFLALVVVLIACCYLC